VQNKAAPSKFKMHKLFDYAGALRDLQVLSENPLNFSTWQEKRRSWSTLQRLEQSPTFSPRSLLTFSLENRLSAFSMADCAWLAENSAQRISNQRVADLCHSLNVFCD